MQDSHAIFQHLNVDNAKAYKVLVALDVFRVAEHLPSWIDIAEVIDDILRDGEFQRVKYPVLAGKLPRPTLQITYDMGYDRNRQMHIQVGAIVPESRLLIIDDVLAVGGTVLACIDLVEQAGGKVVGVSVAVELERFGARSRIEQRGISFDAAVRL